ncbi:MAG: hypothetical protein AAGI24_13050 [Pseudomonadota bacterium]
MPTLGELAKQEFVKDVVAMGIFGIVAALIFLGIQGFYSDAEGKQMEREAAFDLEIRFMTDGGNRIKDNFANYVAGVSEVVTQGVPPDRETRKDILAASSIIRTEVAILSEYDIKLKVRGDLLVKRMDALSDNISSYSRSELLEYQQQLIDVKEDYQLYILKLNAVAKAHLLVRPSPYQ